MRAAGVRVDVLRAAADEVGEDHPGAGVVAGVRAGVREGDAEVGAGREVAVVAQPVEGRLQQVDRRVRLPQPGVDPRQVPVELRPLGRIGHAAAGDRLDQQVAGDGLPAAPRRDRPQRLQRQAGGGVVPRRVGVAQDAAQELVRPVVLEQTDHQLRLLEAVVHRPSLRHRGAERQCLHNSGNTAGIDLGPVRHLAAQHGERDRPVRRRHDRGGHPPHALLAEHHVGRGLRPARRRGTRARARRGSDGRGSAAARPAPAPGSSPC